MRSIFPYKEPIVVGDLKLSAEEIILGLDNRLTNERKQRIDFVVGNRTYAITPVLDGLYDVGNMNAVLRTAEALGFQSVHIIETSSKYKQANRVTQGAEKWLDIMRWKTPIECISWLKDKGYKICVTSFNDAKPIDEVDFVTPTAIVLGNEHEGVSKEMIANADERVVIPMYGFTRSFNISVAGGMILYHAVKYRIKHLGMSGDLSFQEKKILKAVFYLRSVEHAEQILRREILKGNEYRV